jgi:hypothetical protein
VYFPTDFGKSPNIKFNEIPSSGSRADICGETDRQADGWRESYDETNSLRYLCNSAQ